MFNCCVREMAEKHGADVADFRFRCKREGWGHSLLLLLSDGREVTVPADKSAYYDTFLNLKTLRDSCYVCPYAGKHRAGDLTLGDFWGVQHNRPDLLAEGELDLQRGVSCLLVNNERGREAVERYGERLYLKEASFDEIAKGNDQLRHPSVLPVDREAYLNAFEEGGWPAITRVWRRRERGPKYWARKVVKRLLPDPVKKALKRALKRG